MNKKTVLIITEGARREVRLISKLFKIYGLDDRYEIISYNSNLYSLYNEMFHDDAPEEYDLISVLRSVEADPDKRKLLNRNFSDVVLVFDMDFQAPDYSPEKIEKMVAHFNNSSDMGKLYINYPMVESFYHMKRIPDPDYYNRSIGSKIIINNKYKTIVANECRNKDYKKYAVDKEECNSIIKQNIAKGFLVANYSEGDENTPGQKEILIRQLEKLKNESEIYVLCTCVYIIPDYNSELLNEAS